MATDQTKNGTGGLWFEHLSCRETPVFRLFCFPYAGGSPEIFRNWQRWFPQEIEVCLVHLPGRGRRIVESAMTRLLDLVNAIADSMGPEIRLPYALYGHSMGALISFELSLELIRRYSTGPQHLFVSGRSAPQWPRTRRPIFHLPHEDFLTELKRLNGTPREILEDPDLLKFFLSVLRADFEMVETYEYQHRGTLNCPITVYSGLNDEDVSLESCQAWREQTTSDCRITMVRGDHFFIRNPKSEFVSVFGNDIVSAVPAWHNAEPINKDSLVLEDQ